MSHDPEILNAFQEELREIKPKLQEVMKKLDKDVCQAGEFATFAQLTHGVYGNAVSLGFAEVGEYSAILSAMCSRCASTRIQRAMPEVHRMMKRYMQQFESIADGLNQGALARQLAQEIGAEKNRASRLEKEIFAFAAK